MDSPENPTPPSSTSPPAPVKASHTRMLRAFALREDAERARAALADHNIESSLREFMVPDGVTGKLVSRECNLLVDPAQAGEATRVMLKLPPSEAPAAASLRRGTNSNSSGGSRLRRRSGPRVKQRGSQFIIIVAVAAAAGSIIFATTYFNRVKPSPFPEDKTLILVEEDLNGDTVPDVWREFTRKWVPVSHAEDRNFDSLPDVRWAYSEGIPSQRRVDLNFDGKFDEFTTFSKNGQPFFTDLRPGERGPILVRKIYRGGALWKILEDRDGDNTFDHVKEFDGIAALIRDEDLPKGSKAGIEENKYPSWPPPPPPKRPDDDDPPAEKVRVNP